MTEFIYSRTVEQHLFNLNDLIKNQIKTSIVKNNRSDN